MTHLGDFEQHVLLAILRLGEAAYGMRIHQELQEIAGRKASLGAIYTTLERLEEKDLVRSSIGEATPERGGKAKKYFQINASGVTSLKRSLESIESMKAGLEPLLGRTL
jgi:PadR family transcriptional regulator PadR